MIVTTFVLAVYLGVVDFGLVTFKEKIPWENLWDKIFGGGA